MSTGNKANACPQCSILVERGTKYCAQCGFPVGTVDVTSKDSFIGQVLPGGYQVLDLLGVGGMGRVYRAEQRALGRTVAVKVIHPHLLGDAKSQARFLTEARATSQLNHPNCVSVFDFGKTEEGQPYLVMEFLRGKNLAQVQVTDGPISFPRMVGVLRQVLMALGEAHDLDIIHRDLKPENIVLENRRRGGDLVKVVDFGLAKLRSPDSSVPGITKPGIVCGTPDYMAPEQGRGDVIDGRTDLYAVGVVMFWLLTGRLPFISKSPTQVVMMHITAPVPDPAEIAPQRELPQPLLNVMYKALTKDRERRYQDANEFITDLDDALRKSTPAARSMIPHSRGSLRCPDCVELVLQAPFCHECGARLPSQTKLKKPTSAPTSLRGRDREINQLLQLHAASKHAPKYLRLVGDAGAGKTQLLNEVLRRLGQAGCRSVIARPDPHWAGVSGHTLHSILSNLQQLSEVAPRVLTPGADIEQALRWLENPKSHPQKPPAVRREVFRQALSAAVNQSQLGQDQAVVVALDDYDRMDSLSRSVIEDFIANSQRARLLMIAAHRPSFKAEWPGEQVLWLGGLPQHVVTEMLRDASERSIAVTEVGGRGVPPLYVSQLIHFNREGGGEAPTGLADLIALRVAMLDPPKRRCLQTLAVLGAPVPESVLHEMVDDEAGNQQSVSTLVRRGFVRPTDDKLEIVHPLFRELVLLAVPAEVRRDLHQKAAMALSDVAPIEALANHARRSEDSMNALFLLEQVAERAFLNGDDTAGILALRKGLDVAREELFRGQLEDPTRAIAIFGRKLGANLSRRGRFSDAEGVLLEALENAGPEVTERTRLLKMLSDAALMRRKSDDAASYLSRACKLAQEAGEFSLAEQFGEELGQLPVSATAGQP